LKYSGIFKPVKIHHFHSGPDTVVVGNSELIKKLPDPLVSFVSSHQLLLIILVPIALSASRGLRVWLQWASQPDAELTRDQLVGLFDVLHLVVKQKSDLFRTKVPLAEKNQWKHRKIYGEITEPDQQLQRLTAAIKGYFEYLSGNTVNYRVGLLEIENNTVADWFTFEPTNDAPRLNAERLRVPTSAASRALLRRDTIVVQSIARECGKKSKDDRRCIRGTLAKEADGSLLTHPIYCPNTKKTVYVLTIRSDQGDCLKESEKEKYLWILQHFATRIILEHHVLTLKRIAEA
jgi:hypothetical protein